MKRSFNYQRVRSHRPYTIAKLAALYDVDPATVRRWIKRNGLDVAIVCKQRPVILQGKLVKAWMKARQTAKKQPCAPDQMYCVRCKEPRHIRSDNSLIVQLRGPKLTAQGDCDACGLTLRRFGTTANRAALEAAFRPKSGGQASGDAHT